MSRGDLVTGGAGFLGRHLVRALAGRGRRVTVLDLDRPDERVPGVRYVRGSVTEEEPARRLLAGADRLFHLAARTDLWAPDRADYERVNRLGTRRVMRLAREEDVARAVHVSTEAILRDFGGAGSGGRGSGDGDSLGGGRGNGASGPDASLRQLPDPDLMPGPYCRSKLLGEREVRDAAARGLPVSVVNPTVPVGPGDPGRTPPGRMILGLLNGDIPAYTAGHLDLVDVRDLARGLVLAAERGAPGRRYVLGGHRVRFRRLLRVLEEVSGVAMPRWRVPYPVSLFAAAASELISDHVTGGRPAATVEGVRLARAEPRFSTERFRRELGLEVRPLRRTLADAVRWLRERGHVRRTPGS